MAFVIAEPCIGTEDTAWVDACPSSTPSMSTMPPISLSSDSSSVDTSASEPRLVKKGVHGEVVPDFDSKAGEVVAIPPSLSAQQMKKAG